jgi:carbonic anhydrase
MVSLTKQKYLKLLFGQLSASNIYYNILFRNGLYQSPININRPYQPEEVKLTINLHSPKGKIRLGNDGYKLIFKADNFGYISHGAHQYDAKEIHIHLPSEHTFGDDEVRSPLEIQIVCEDIFGNSAALAVLFKIDKKDNEFLNILGFGLDNPLFALKLRNGETIDLKENPKLDLGKYLNNVQHYVYYTGSLTTPPCKQNVQWFVLLKKLSVSASQLEYFPVLFGNESNIRGLQPLNNRLFKII